MVLIFILDKAWHIISKDKIIPQGRKTACHLLITPQYTTNTWIGTG